MTTPTNPRPPAKLGSRGRAFWRAVVDEYLLTPAELVLLEQLCRAIDRAEALRKVIDDEGVVATGSKDQRVAHPAVARLDATATLIAKLLAQLGLDDEHGESVPSPRSAAAQTAARGRWRDHVKRQNVTKLRGGTGA